MSGAVMDDADLFPEEEQEKRDAKSHALVEQAERKINRERRWGGMIGWAAAAGIALVALLEAVTICRLLPLHTTDHHFTVLHDDGTSYVAANSSELSPSMEERLILATAGRYAIACSSWDWVSASNSFMYCRDLSAGSRRTFYEDAMNPDKNPKAPQKYYGTKVTVGIKVTRTRRVAPNSIAVDYVRTEYRQNDWPRVTPFRAVYDYVKVKSLPAELDNADPTADINFFRTRDDVDTAELAAQAAAPVAPAIPAPGAPK